MILIMKVMKKIDENKIILIITIRNKKIELIMMIKLITRNY